LEFIKIDQFVAFAIYIYKGLSTELKLFEQSGMLANLPESDLLKNKATDLVLKDLIKKIREDVKTKSDKTSPSK
jgi:hypothetical protein